MNELLDAVEHGETIVITRDGKPVARLQGPPEDVDDQAAWVEEVKAFGRAHRGALKGLDIKELINEGRRF